MTVERLSPHPGGNVPFNVSTYEPYVAVSPILQDVKRRMEPWLWKECIAAINESNLMNDHPGSAGLSKRVQEQVMQLALHDFAKSYPPRPKAPLPPSPTVDALRDILKDAPSYPTQEDWGNEFDNLDIGGDTWPDYETKYEWSKEFLGRVFHALRDIIEAHGMGDQGWASARWEVYETVRDHPSQDSSVVLKRQCSTRRR